MKPRFGCSLCLAFTTWPSPSTCPARALLLRRSEGRLNSSMLQYLKEGWDSRESSEGPLFTLRVGHNSSCVPLSGSAVTPSNNNNGCVIIVTISGLATVSPQTILVLLGCRAYLPIATLGHDYHQTRRRRQRPASGS